MAINQRHLVFVYGSLKQGFYNHYVLQGCQAVKIAQAVTCEVFGMFTDEGGRYPYLIPSGADDEGFSVVEGELYEVSMQGLEVLDEFEDAPRSYQREMIVVATHEHIHEAYAYLRHTKAPKGETPMRVWCE